ncbi:MAG: hypothetical protein C0603_05305 [Denitrovibrio sp.]|nr:MAG: hypothetical protein C0603_05305 [Denitrovibrio sp.]
MELKMTAEMLNINAEICRMFSVMFYNPKESFLTEPSTIGELSELLKTLNKDLNFDAEKLIKDTLLTDETELLLDYAALFIGPYQLQAPPYGSVYLDKAKRLNDESTAAVTDIYRQFGLDVESSMNEPADHIAIELEFIHTALIMIDNKKAAGEDT